MMMMAAGWTSSAYTSGSMGVFTSIDGVNWADQGQKLTLSQFHYDIANTMDINEIGVPTIIKRSVTGDYFLLFEAGKNLTYRAGGEYLLLHPLILSEPGHPITVVQSFCSGNRFRLGKLGCCKSPHCPNVRQSIRHDL